MSVMFNLFKDVDTNTLRTMKEDAEKDLALNWELTNDEKIGLELIIKLLREELDNKLIKLTE